MPKGVHFLECSDAVGAALGPDVLKSVKHLVPDILASLPLLLYQGGVTSHEFPSSSLVDYHSVAFYTVLGWLYCSI